MSEIRPRKKQSGVIVSAVPASQSQSQAQAQAQSPPPLPALSSGSSSPSISSVDTDTSAGGRGASSPSTDDHGIVSFITSMPGSSGEDVELASRASSSSWGTAAPSSDSMARSLAASLSESGVESRMYICLFHMLDCHDSFDDVSLWRTHVLSHFRTHPPPSTARCPLCPDIKFVDDELRPATTARNHDDELVQSDDSKTDAPSTNIEPSAWNRMLDHVATDHYQQGQTLAGSRADFELMRYLYGLRIITDAQFKAMQLAPAPSSPAYHRSQDGVRASIGSSDEPYCAPYSRRREERMRGQQRGVSVV